MSEFRCQFGVKLEDSGKMRVFAIANPLFQTLVRPLNDWVMDVLRRLPTDGTYNQTVPLARSKSFLFLRSQSRLLLSTLFRWVKHLVFLFGRRLAESWIYILCAFGFRLPEKGPSPNYMSSGLQRVNLQGFTVHGLCSLTHHMLVWYATWRVRPGVKFFDYALLGDEIVIADPVVAKSYLEVMEECEVTISKEKSLT